MSELFMPRAAGNHPMTGSACGGGFGFCVLLFCFKDVLVMIEATERKSQGSVGAVIPIRTEARAKGEEQG